MLGLFCLIVGYHCTKVSTKCAKLVYEKIDYFVVLSVRDFEPKILIKVYILQLLKKTVRKVYILLISKSICHPTTLFL